MRYDTLQTFVHEEDYVEASIEQYACEIQEVRGTFYGRFPDLPGSDFVARSSDTIESVAEEEFSKWLERASSAGLRTPSPGSAEKMTGIIRLRIPRSIHRHLLGICNQNDVSLSSLATSLLYAGAEWLETGLLTPECTSLGNEDLSINVPPGRHSRYDEEGASGSWTQNLPKDLHFRLTWLSDIEAVSLNMLCSSLITRSAFSGDIRRERTTTRMTSIAA